MAIHYGSNPNRSLLSEIRIEHTDYTEYVKNDVNTTSSLIDSLEELKLNLLIRNVIFNPPATIIFWGDGTKTVVKCQNDEEFDPEKGMAMAIAKKHFGNKGSYCNQIKKWTEKYEEEQPTWKGYFDAFTERVREKAEIIRDADKHNKVVKAYKILVNAISYKRPRKSDLEAAMEEAIGYLGEVLDD